VFRFLLLVALVSTSGQAQERPRLGVMIVVDQLSVDSFDKRLPLAKGGFKRLVDQGLRFREAQYQAAPTLTSSGHATLATGAYASVHGVVSNEWTDWQTGKNSLSTEDPAFTVLGRPAAKQDGTAPTFLRVPTLGDSVKVNDARGKVVAISAKDRSAILMAGRSADAVVWFDTERPSFTSSTFYGAEIPAFVGPVNQRIGEALLKKMFTWGLPGGGITGANSMPVGSGRQGDSEPDAEQPSIQPLLDGWQVDLALGAVKSMQLGADDAVDLLMVSFSGHDRIGHAFGPDSPEGLAEFLAVDRELGRLLTGLDQQIGKGAWVAVLSSDHGVAPVPELLKERRLDAGRIDMKALMVKLEQEADTRLGAGDWFASRKTPGFTATPKGRDRLNTITDGLRELARKQPGVLDLLPVSKLLDGSLGPSAEPWRRGFFAGRSPDFIVVSKPYWLYGTTDVTGHASQWLYDRAVPLVFCGAGVPKGAAASAEAIDIAPTFARLLGVPSPAGSQGRTLDAVFR
jgi:predicted AlkP superfamily pyrophosphatase or phosphodiesterase